MSRDMYKVYKGGPGNQLIRKGQNQFGTESVKGGN